MVEGSQGFTARTLILSALSGLAAAAALYLINILREPTGWLLIAAGLAVALSGLVGTLSRYMRRPAALAVVYSSLVVVVLVIGGLVVPSLATSADELARNVPAYARDATSYVRTHELASDLDGTYDLTGRLEDAETELPGTITDTTAALAEGGVGPLNAVLPLLVIPLLAGMLLNSGPRWVDAWVREWEPERAQAISRTLERINRTLQHYLLGAFAQAIVAGLASYLALRLAGVAYADLLALVVFVLDLIPRIGPFISTPLVGLVTLVDGFPTSTVVWALFSIAYLWATNRLMWTRPVTVSPLGAVISVVFGVALLGPVGALVAVPVVALLQVVLREWLSYRRVRIGLPPVGPAPEP